MLLQRDPSEYELRHIVFDEFAYLVGDALCACLFLANLLLVYRARRVVSAYIGVCDVLREASSDDVTCFCLACLHFFVIRLGELCSWSFQRGELARSRMGGNVVGCVLARLQALGYALSCVFICGNDIVPCTAFCEPVAALATVVVRLTWFLSDALDEYVSWMTFSDRFGFSRRSSPLTCFSSVLYRVSRASSSQRAGGYRSKEQASPSWLGCI